MRRDISYFATLGLVGLVTVPTDLAAVQALPLGPGMQLLLAIGLAVVTAVAAHVGAKALADVIDGWPRRFQVPWRFWLDAGLAAALVGGTLAMLLAFGLLRGDTLSVITGLSGDAELLAASGAISAALFLLQLVAYVLALVLGVKRQQGLARARLERELARLDKLVAAEQVAADQAARTIVAADNTRAKLGRDVERVRQQIEAWALERHKRTDYSWQKRRITAQKRQRRVQLRQLETPVVDGAPDGDSSPAAGLTVLAERVRQQSTAANDGRSS